MVATNGLFLLVLLASSSYNFGHGYSRSVRHCRTSKIGRIASSSSSSSEPRRQSRRHGQSSLYLQPPEKVGDQDGVVLASRKAIVSDDVRWDIKFSLLQEFRNREGHCDVKSLYREEDGENLGGWVVNQRQAKRRGTLSQDRAKRLEDLGFSWDMIKSKWAEHFSLMVAFQHREGHCEVTGEHIEKGLKLGLWVVNQRRLKNQGLLDASREKSLEDIGFVWKVTPSNWESNLSLLKQFKKREGHCNVPRSHEEDGAPLGRWVATQRHRKTLNQERMKSLEKVGLLWDGFLSNQQRYEVEWEKRLSVLEKFRDREGHCNVPLQHKEEGVNLGSWVGTQRQAFKHGKLQPHRQERLEAAGFVVKPNFRQARTWEESFLLLGIYKTREGHCNVPMKYKEDGANLGTWIANQRTLKKKGTLAPERELALEEIGFVFEIPRGRKLKTS